MKLIFNIEPLIGELTGVGVFTLQLLKATALQPEVEEIQLFSGYRYVGAYTPEVLDDLLIGPSTNEHIRRRFPITARLPIEWLWRASRCLHWLRTYKYRSYLYVETSSILRPFAGKTLLFCHDLSVIRYREFHPATRVKFFDHYFRQSIERSSMIATISPPIADEITKQFNKSCSLVVPPAVDMTPYPDADHPLPYLSGYILTVGSLEPRKNLDRLITAFKKLPDELRKSFPLVFVGGQGWRNERLLHEIEDLVQLGEAYQLGYVSNADLQRLYASASLFAFLSHYEGFGIPVIEAMSAGAPVLISQDPALLDTAGGAAETIDEQNVEAISDVLLKLLSNPQRREDLRALGFDNAKRFSWQTSAQKLIEGLKKL